MEVADNSKSRDKVGGHCHSGVTLGAQNMGLFILVVLCIFFVPFLFG